MARFVTLHWPRIITMCGVCGGVVLGLSMSIMNERIVLTPIGIRKAQLPNKKYSRDKFKEFFMSIIYEDE